MKVFKRILIFMLAFNALLTATDVQSKQNLVDIGSDADFTKSINIQEDVVAVGEGADKFNSKSLKDAEYFAYEKEAPSEGIMGKIRKVLYENFETIFHTIHIIIGLLSFVFLYIILSNISIRFR